MPQAPKSFAGTKRWLSQLFFNELNQHAVDGSGAYKTNGQLMVENVIRLATDTEQDPYVQLAAAKFILDRMEGKAAAMQEDNHEEMPKLVICVGNATPEQMKKAVSDNEGAEPEEDVFVEISDEDGENKESALV